MSSTALNSPDVATYDLKPEMSAVELTDQLVQAIRSSKYDVIICNYANPDMVGHTGSIPAAVARPSRITAEAARRIVGRSRSADGSWT